MAVLKPGITIGVAIGIGIAVARRRSAAATPCCGAPQTRTSSCC